MLHLSVLLFLSLFNLFLLYLVLCPSAVVPLPQSPSAEQQLNGDTVKQTF